MARIVQLACARCGHLQMHVVESAENDEAAAEIVETAVDDTLASAAMRLRRLEFLPTSLPVGGIITPV
jgi:hypothetical protein